MPVGEAERKFERYPRFIRMHWCKPRKALPAETVSDDSYAVMVWCNDVDEQEVPAAVNAEE